MIVPSTPEIIDYPVKTRDDWERVKERLKPDRDRVDREGGWLGGSAERLCFYRKLLLEMQKEGKDTASFMFKEVAEMRKIIIAVITVMVCSLQAVAFDAEKLDTDVAAVGSFLQRMANPRSRGSNLQGTAIYCEGYGIVVTFYTYFDSSRTYDARFDQSNEELTRGLALYLSSIRQLGENEKVVVAMKNSNQPYQTYVVQAQTNDLIAFLRGKIELEELMKKIRVNASAFVDK